MITELLVQYNWAFQKHVGQPPCKGQHKEVKAEHIEVMYYTMTNCQAQLRVDRKGIIIKVLKNLAVLVALPLDFFLVLFGHFGQKHATVFLLFCLTTYLLNSGAQ